MSRSYSGFLITVIALALFACDSSNFAVTGTTDGTGNADITGNADSNPAAPVASAATAPLGGADGVGEWGSIIDLPIVPVGAANLPDGQVLFWHASDKLVWFGSTATRNKTWTALFNPETEQTQSHLITDPAHDMFCPGTSNLTDGSILISGGISNKRTSIFDPFNNQWRATDNLNIGRGYHAHTVLASGDVLTLGGSWSGGQGNKHGEIYSSSDGWTRLTGLPVTPLLNGIADPLGVYRNDNHAWLWTAPNGDVFHAGPSKNMHWIKTEANGSFSDAGPRADDAPSLQGTTVMYDIGKLLKAGGAASYTAGHPATDSSYTIDINQGTPQVRRQPDLTHTRTMHNSVVLPNGEVMLVGGVSKARSNDDGLARLIPEIWNPATGQWRTVASLSTPRQYHSIAILLPDGRVLAAGGGACGSCPTNHPDAEIYSPSYLFDDNNNPAIRPVVFSVPSNATYGDMISVQTDSPINEFSLVRLSSVTHSTNNDQRRVPLAFTTTGGNIYDLKIPSNRGVVLPGYYMLFAMNQQGTPSVAQMIQIGEERQTSYNFDFGTSTSPVRSGWTRVTHNSNDSLVSWTGAARSSTNRSASPSVNEINRDFVHGSGTSRLNLNIGNGTWKVILNMGDSATQLDNMSVKMEDETVFGDIDSNAGQFVYVTPAGASSRGADFEVTVTDGSLNVEFADNGGNDIQWAVNRLSLSLVPTPVTPIEANPNPVPDPNNLLSNGGFTNNTAGWETCGGQLSVNGGRVNLTGDGCLFQEFNIIAGAEYTLMCDALVNADFASIQLSASDVGFQTLISDSVPVTSATMSSLTAQIVASAGARTGVVTLYGQSSATFDNCVVAVNDGTQPNPVPVLPTQNDILVNNDFENATASWTSCGGGQVITNDGVNGGKSLKLSDAGCLYQDFPITPGQSYEVSCTAMSNVDYTSINLSTYDSNYVEITNDEKPIVSALYAKETLSVDTSANTRIGVLTLYADTDATFDSCGVVATNQITPPPSTVVANNLLSNGDFSQSSANWLSCGGSQEVQHQGATGNYSMLLTNGGCVYQEFATELNATYKMSCQGRATGFASATLGFSDTNYNTLSSSEIPIVGVSSSGISVTGVAPVSAERGVITLYADQSAVVDNCSIEKIN